MLLTLLYEAITGISINADLELVFATATFVAMCGDSVILLVFDCRWNAATRELWAKMR